MSVKAVPLRLQPVFNIANYQQATEYLGSSGNQTLRGALNITRNETIQGDETVYGESTMFNEPTILNISNASQLTDYNLPSKRYVDYAILHPPSEPQLTAISDTNLLTGKHLISKQYVDDQIYKFYQYPTSFNYGRAYNAVDANNTLMILSGQTFIKFRDRTFRNYTVFVEINYNITRNAVNTFDVSNGITGTNPSLYYHSIYALQFFQSDTGNFLPNKTLNYLVDGNTLHDNITTCNQTFKPIVFGVENGSPVIKTNFPSNSLVFDNNPTVSGWVSSYNVDIKLLTSIPANLYTPTYSQQYNAYFSNTYL